MSDWKVCSPSASGDLPVIQRHRRIRLWSSIAVLVLLSIAVALAVWARPLAPLVGPTWLLVLPSAVYHHGWLRGHAAARR